MISSDNGSLLLSDSIFILPIPEPYLTVEGSSDNAISYSRILGNKKIKILAQSPNLNTFKYTITQIKYRLIGISGEVLTAGGSIIELPTENIDKLKYLIVDNVQFKNDVRTTNYSKSIVLQIRK